MDDSAGAGDGGDAAPLLRQWRRLAGEGVLLDGFHAVKHALRFGADVPLALTEDRAPVLALADALAPDVAPALAGLLRDVPAGTLRRLVTRPHPTGVAALAVRRDEPFAGAGPPGLRPRSGAEALPGSPAGRPDGRRTAPLIVLDEPRHLGNVGAVVRLAAGAGAAGVLTTGPLDPWHPGVVRASAGLHFATAVGRADAETLPPGPLFALDPEGGDLRDVELPDGALLAFGSERHGLTDALRRRADALVSLPMEPLVSSYNLATSVAMTLYHWMSRRP